MAFESWRDAADALSVRLAPPEPELTALASALGIEGSEDAARLILVARIEDAVATITGHNTPRPNTERQIDLLASLDIQATTGLSRREADAVIQVAIARERLKALQALRPVRGDKLVLAQARWSSNAGEVIEVSSIDRLGQVWAKKAGGYPALPQDLCRLPP